VAHESPSRNGDARSERDARRERLVETDGERATRASRVRKAELLEGCGVEGLAECPAPAFGDVEHDVRRRAPKTRDERWDRARDVDRHDRAAEAREDSRERSDRLDRVEL